MTEAQECPGRKGPGIPGGCDRADVRLAFAFGLSLGLHVLAIFVPVSGEGAVSLLVPVASRSLSLTLTPATPLADHSAFAAPVATNQSGELEATTAETGPNAGNPLSSPQGRYVPVRQLTRPPQALTRFEDLLARLGLTTPGRIEFRLWLNEAGVIDRIELIDTTLEETETEELLNTFRKMRFLPGDLGGRPVASVGRIVVEMDQPENLPAHPSLTPTPAPSATEN